ncbi:MAG: hypothetical protein AAF726_06735 [Planctomycetota bacterium]
MTTPHRLRIPLRGAIFTYAAVAVSLFAMSRLARSAVVVTSSASESGLEGLLRDDATGVQALAAQLLGADQDATGVDVDSLLPLLGGGELESLTRFDESSEVPELVLADDTRLMTARDLWTRRPANWSYPRFDTDGRHGAPLRATPRNVTLRLVDEHDEPFVARRIDIVQGGDDGTHRVNAYRMTSDATLWTIGSPALTPGARASFELHAIRGGEVRYARVVVASVPEAGDVDIGLVRVSDPLRTPGRPGPATERRSAGPGERALPRSASHRAAH